MQLLRPHRTELWVQDERALPVTTRLLAIPGVKYIEPEAGYTCWRLVLPRTVWEVDVVCEWLANRGLPPPPQEFAFPGVAEACPAHIWEKLYPHQRSGVDFVLRQGSALVGDAMGLGKTYCALTAATIISGQLEDRPVLIVAPKSVRGVWQREIKQWGLPGAEALVTLTGVQPEPMDERLMGARWIFAHYDIVHAWWSLITEQRPCVVILDEAHLVRNGRTRRGRAAALAASGAPHRILLTGTPILNRVGEAWNLLSLTTGGWTWGTPNEFRTRYAGAIPGTYGLVDVGPTHEDELKTRMRSCYIRRTVESAGLDLPPITRQRIDVEPTEHELAQYADLFEGYDVKTVIAAICGRGASLKTIRWLGKLRKLTSRMKLKTTLETISAALEEGESVVCFTWERAMANKIVGLFSNKYAVTLPRADVLGQVHEQHVWSYLVTGAIPQHGRDANIDMFQAHGGLMTATIDSMSVGVTLTKARIVVMHDLDWVPASMLQAEARVYRIGQTRPVLSKWVVAKSTLDEMLIAAVRRKAPAIASVVGDEDPGDLLELLGEGEMADRIAEVIAWARGGG